MNEQETAKPLANLKELREQAAALAAEQDKLRIRLAATVERSAKLIERIVRAERNGNESAT